MSDDQVLGQEQEEDEQEADQEQTATTTSPNPAAEMAPQRSLLGFGFPRNEPHDRQNQLIVTGDSPTADAAQREKKKRQRELDLSMYVLTSGTL